MSGTSRKSQMVSFRLSLDALAKINKALSYPANDNSSVSDYCKQVVERHAFRHDKRKYKAQY